MTLQTDSRYRNKNTSLKMYYNMLACRLPSFVSIHAHIITMRTKITKDLKLKKNERNLNYVIWCMYLVREYMTWPCS